MCIYELDDASNPFLLSFFSITEGSTITISALTDKNLYFPLFSFEYFQSTIKSKNSKPFFCILNIDGDSFCFIYDLYDANANRLLYYDPYNEKKCVKEPYNIKTYYFPETGEYVFSCLTIDNGIQTTIYNKSMEKNSDILNPSMRLQKEFPGCPGFNYSLIYSQYYKKYYVISDIACGSYKNFFPLIEEEIEEEEEEIINDVTEEEKEIIKYIKKEEKEENKIEEEKSIIEEEKKKEDEEKLVIEEGKEKEIEKEYYIEEEKILENKEEVETKSKSEEEEKIDESPKEEEKEEEKELFICNLEKCSDCTEESIKLNLCTKCNTIKEYYPLNIGESSSSQKFINCYNSTTKPENFYLDKENKEYKLCYSDCKTCNYSGDGNENNCTSCKNGQRLKPDIINSTNCVTQCDYFYYYQNDKYKCTENEICPENYELLIKEKRKCIDKCENDNTYIIQYDGECYKETPEGTIYDSTNKISKDIDINKCKLTEKALRLITNENITENEIKQKAKLYAKEFDYTNNHITLYKNDLYNITLYKNGECLSELNLNIDEIDFGECYTKIKETFNITTNLIIVIISKKINGISLTIDKFIFDPKTGEKINYLEICQNKTVVTVKRNLKEQMKNTENINSLEKLTEQGINIFDQNSDFYTDICFHFKSPIDGKDIPLKDRLKLFFPNITLCNEGCFIKGVNLTTWKQCANVL